MKVEVKDKSDLTDMDRLKSLLEEVTSNKDNMELTDSDKNALFSCKEMRRCNIRLCRTINIPQTGKFVKSHSGISAT